MESAAAKRSRSSNWDEHEKRLLRQLVTERIDIIENKDASTNTHSAKKIAWQEVLTCFNSINNKPRNLTQLVTQWRNTKNKLKSKDYEYRRARLQTGGGPPPPSPPAEDVAIIEAIPNEFVVDFNVYDSDSHYMKTVDQPPKSPKKDEEMPTTSKAEIENSSEGLHSAKLADINTGSKHKRDKSNKKLRSCEDYEKELFLITKEAKLKEIERAEALHKEKVKILDLEKQYWRKKIEKLD